MNENKKILEYCPNYYDIINFEYLDGDSITSKIIEIYHNFIFKIDVKNIEELEEVKELDHVVYKYIEDYAFRKEMQKEIITIKGAIDTKEHFKDIIRQIIKIFDNYEEYTTRAIYISRWI